MTDEPQDKKREKPRPINPIARMVPRFGRKPPCGGCRK